MAGWHPPYGLRVTGLTVQISSQLSCESAGVFDFAFPYLQNAPTKALQLSALTNVALFVRFDLRPPILDPRFRHLVDFAAMAVPETPVDEDRHAESR